LTPAARHAFRRRGTDEWDRVVARFAVHLDSAGVRCDAPGRPQFQRCKAALALVVFVVSPLAQIVGRGVSDRFAARAGLIGTAVALAALLGAVPARSLALFALGGIVAGAAHGARVLGRAEHRQPHRAGGRAGPLVGALLRDHLRVPSALRSWRSVR